jgi:hypothetical protein
MVTTVENMTKNTHVNFVVAMVKRWRIRIKIESVNARAVMIKPMCREEITQNLEGSTVEGLGTSVNIKRIKINWPKGGGATQVETSYFSW